jgi:3-deoxy-D-manno-octulosonate 8-phosphate phosphatase (KDO 8-P phosphatase)
MLFNKEIEKIQSAAAKVELLLLDVDGVLTDGRLYFSNSGEELNAFSTLDGHGIKMLRSVGIEVGIITGRTSNLLERRAVDLGIKLLYQGREDKLNVLNDILADKTLEAGKVCYVGDDLPDLPVLRAVGLSISVPMGHPDIRATVDAVTQAPAGLGAVREVTDFLLQCRGSYQQFIDS